MKTKKVRILLLALLAVILLTAALYAVCGNFNGWPGHQTENSSAADYADAPNYADAANWISLPDSPKQNVDVFYLYPTAWYKTDEGEPNVCRIDDPTMRRLAPLAFGRQATAFETSANLYAPFYRQADAQYILSLPPEKRVTSAEAISVADATAAFEYYIENCNNGRPFILAGHSQGSIVLEVILSDYMEKNPEVYRRMIAAYIIGYSVTKEYMEQNPHLKFAEGPDDTGVIISYNTEAPATKAKNGVVLPGALVINPITWTRDETPATAEQNLGSIKINADGTVALDKQGEPIRVRNYADATIDQTKGVVICSTAEADKLAPGGKLFGKGIYHSFDYPLYYFNLRENAANRIDKYLSQQQLQ